VKADAADGRASKAFVWFLSERRPDEPPLLVFPTFVPPVELDREEDSRCLGLAVGHKRVIAFAFEVWVVQIDIGTPGAASARWFGKHSRQGARDAASSRSGAR